MATNTAPSFTEHTAPSSGSTAGPYSISFSYIDEDEVDVTVDGVLKTKTTHYTFASATTIQFTSGNNPANSAAIKFQRDTNIGAKKVDFQDGSVLTETDLDSSTDQLLFGLQELSDDYVKRDGSQTVTGNLVFEGSADDNNETTLAVTNPTADRTITLPDTTGTVVTTGDSGTVTSTMINDGTIVNADINASAAIDGTKISPNFGSQNIVTSGTVDGRDVSTDGTKLDGIESGATADQTAAEIRTLVGNATDSNVFTDAEKTKLSGIEASATADQTAAEIRTLVGDATDSNVFTDAEKTKLNGIESGATQDQTGAEIKSAYEAESNTNAFTDTEKSKLAAIEASADVTDATNVDAAGAVMNSDLDVKGEILVGDGSGDPTALSVGQNGYILTADSTVAAGVKWAANSGGGGGSGITDVVSDTTPQLGGNLDVQTNEITTSTTNGNIKLNPNGTGVVEVKGDGSSTDGTLQLNCSQNTHGVKIKSPAHSAGASYSLTLPINIQNGGRLKTDTNGVLSWDTNTYLQANQQIIGSSILFGGSQNVVFDTDNNNTHTISFIGPSTLTKTSAFTLPEDGSNGQFLKTNGSGVLSFGTVTTDLVNDTTPQLGGTLDTNGQDVDFKGSGGTTKILFDSSQDQLEFADSTTLTFGDHSTTGDYNISYVNGADFTLLGMNGGSGDLVLGTFANGTTTKNLVSKRSNNAVELYFGGSKKAETVTGGFTITGTCTATSFAGDGSALTGVAATTGGGAIYENSATISVSRTIPSGSNGMSAGPISIANGVSLVVSSGSVYTVV